MSITTFPAPAVAVTPTKHLRTWPALLTLMFLSPVTAEVLTGSTPIITFLTNPISFISNVLLYGSGAILIREVVCRRRLPWSSVIWLGVAYGIFEEGMVVDTWADPWLPQVCTIVKGKPPAGLCDYSRVSGINLAWAVSLTAFHAIVSIAIPLLLIGLLFPRRAALPWLGRKAPFAFVFAEVLVLAFGLLFNMYVYRQHHIAFPPLGPYLIEIALMAVCIVVALNLKPARPSTNTRRAPRLWTLRIFGFVTTAVFILIEYVFQGAHVLYQIELAVYCTLLALAIWRVTAWSRRAGWNERHMLALASGALGFFLLIWDPLIELAGTAGGHPTRGTILVALAYLIGLIILARRVRARTVSLPVTVVSEVAEAAPGFHKSTAPASSVL